MFLTWITTLCVLSFITGVQSSTWAEWWTYDGVSGPDYWGRLNLEWSLCKKGQKQSPVDIQTGNLRYDPHLRHVRVSKHRVSGSFKNTGHDIRISLDDEGEQSANISGGPLQYHYRVSDVIIRFGRDDNHGSEHAIDGQYFPSEIQIMAWNSDVYSDMTQAMQSPNGLAIIALLVKIGDSANAEFKVISDNLNTVKYKGNHVRVSHLSVHNLLPVTEQYMTYEGSLTYPACHETVTWIIPNKPFYITRADLTYLRHVMVGDADQPLHSMQNNLRPVKPLHHRPVVTNINFANTSKSCTMERKTYYQVNVMENS